LTILTITKISIPDCQLNGYYSNNIRHRYRWNAPSKLNKPSLLAKAPNKVWSWDISFLRNNVRGKFFYLYLFMDIFSRKIVGWDVLEKEDSSSAANTL